MAAVNKALDRASAQAPQTNERFIPTLPKEHESFKFHGWNISYTQSHILKSVCVDQCTEESGSPCELCVYQRTLGLPHLPDMVFHKNVLRLEHESGAVLEFNPMDALKLVENGKMGPKVACAGEWRESRSPQHTEEKCKPFDWTFKTDYAGTINEKFQVEDVDMQLDFKKLARREEILFYTDITLFEDELHDNGIAKYSVKIRVMPSGYYILARYFLRLDKVMCMLNDARYHYEVENDYVLRECIARSEECDKMKFDVRIRLHDNNLQNPETLLPQVSRKTEKLKFQ